VLLYENPDHHIYLLIYQCYVKKELALKMAIVTVTNETMEDLNNTVRSLDSQLEIPVPI